MNYNAMLSMIKVELNKQTEELKKYIKDEYAKAYHDGFIAGYDHRIKEEHSL